MRDKVSFVALEYRWITRTSRLSGKTRKVMLAATPAQWEAYANGELIQRALPDLSPAEREFLMTGITDEEWATLKDEDD